MMADKTILKKQHFFKQHLTKIKALVVLLPTLILVLIPASGNYTPAIKLFFIIE